MAMITSLVFFTGEVCPQSVSRISLILIDSQEFSHNTRYISQVFNLIGIVGMVFSIKYRRHRVSTMLAMFFLLDIPMVAGDDQEVFIMNPGIK